MLVGLLGSFDATQRAASHFQNNHGCHKLDLTSNLAEACALMFGLDRAMFTDIPRRFQPQFANGATPTQLVFHANCLVHQFKPELILDQLKLCALPLVVTEVLFQADREYIKALGGFVIRLREKNLPFNMNVAPDVVTDFVIEFDSENLEFHCDRVLAQFKKQKALAEINLI
jgi:hypothetical protein